MTLDFAQAETIINDALGRVAPAIQVEVRVRGHRALSRAAGWLDPETRRQPTRRDTLFDLASVTKLFVVTAFMTLIEDGVVSLDQPVASVLPEFSGERPIQPYEDPLKPGAFVSIAGAPGTETRPTSEAAGGAPAVVDAGRVTFRNLIVHNSGLPAWRPLYKQGSPDAARQMALATHFSYATGARVIYSDIGLILLGMSMERLTGLSLDEIVRRRVTRPLGLVHTRYLDVRARQKLGASVTMAPTELCAWRQRRIVGEVHDENAAGMGGIVGHAGLFSTASDVAALGQSFLVGLQPVSDRRGERALLAPETIAQMTRLQAEDGATRRGLGFALWSRDPEASGNPFSERAFGHTGFTGTSLWVDPQRAVVVACLTNRVYNGRAAGGILAFRVSLHRAIVQAVDAGEALSP